MKNFSQKFLIFLFPTCALFTANAQSNVGIGTTTPNSKAALEVVSSGNNQGILIPRLSAAQRLAIAVGASENSLLVYDKDSAAYMYWNGAAWKLLLSGSTTTVTANNGLTKTGSNIALGGTLTSNTSVAMGANTLTFTGGKLGIGTLPTQTFEVRGAGSTGGTLTMRLTNSLANTLFTVADDGSVGVNNKLQTNTFQVINGAAAGSVLTSDATGNATWQAPAGPVTADNGLTKTGSNIALGGALTAATDVNTSGFNLSFSGTGNVGIGMVPGGAYKLEVNGLLKTSGITEVSDIRWKKNINTIDHALTKVMQLRGVTYNWRANEFKDKNFESTTQIGLIAQEVEKVFPELVKTDVNGYKSVEYSKVVAILIQAVKEQQLIIAGQQEQITDLKVQTTLDEQKYKELVQVLIEKGLLDLNWNQKLSSEAVTK
jgi:hypothetical protein